MNLTLATAIAEVLDKATRWGENFEEGFTARAEASWTNEKCEEVAEASGYEVDEVIEVRDLWRACELLTKLKNQENVGGSIILITGNPVDGFSFTGPFDNEVEAIDWGGTSDRDTTWWTGELINPNPAADEESEVTAA